MEQQSIYPLTVNWHFINRCNMSCKYCFVPKQSEELSLSQSLSILSKLRNKFTKINFVGGEPTLSPYLPLLVKEAKALGFVVSIITNGYELIYNEDHYKSLYKSLDIIGLSVDSLNHFTNCTIGRCIHNKSIPLKDYQNLCNTIKENNITLKINTVVSKLNKDEDFSSFYEVTNPDKIKIFQVLKPNLTLKHTYDDMLISKEEFYSFIARHKRFDKKLCIEDNNMMLNSYYMLDSKGRFIDNSTGRFSKSLLHTTLEDALKDIYLDEEKYIARNIK